MRPPTSHISPSVHTPDPPDLDDLCAPLSEKEISTAISELRNGRAPEMDGITAEMIKRCGAESEVVKVPV